MNWNLTLQRAPGIEIGEVTDGFIASCSDGQRIHHLNPSAALILEVCGEATPASDLPELLAAAFELMAPPTEDVELCINEFLKEGLLLIIQPNLSSTD
jgi:hypothetical protein